MRTVNRSQLVTADLSGGGGGFVECLLKERSVLTAAREAAGEGSREQGLWGVGSYRSRWTTFRIFPSVAVPVSSGSSIQSVEKQR
jgi:hypothetical protein